MEIGWLSDYSTDNFQGGASLTNEQLINEGKKRGHEIIFQEYKTFNQEDLKDTDLIVLTNINLFQKKDIEWVINNKPFVKYEHDYCFCRFRNVRCGELCKIKCRPVEIFQSMFGRSKLNIFMSKLQLDIYKKFFNNIMFRDAKVIPPPIQTDRFFPDDNVREPKTALYLGLISEHKGIFEIISKAKQLKQKGFKVDFAGRIVHEKIKQMIEEEFNYIGEIPHDQVPNLMRRYNFFLIAPKMRETFGITKLEAELSGCEIIRINDVPLGIESYNKNIQEIKALCDNAHNVWWEEIEKIENKFIINYCNKCNQMTNHKYVKTKLICQKCKVEK